MRSIEELTKGIKARHQDLDAHAQEAETLGKASDQLVQIMRDLKVPLVKVPAEAGGDQLSMNDQLLEF